MLRRRGEASAWLHTTLVSGPNKGRNCFHITLNILLSLLMQSFSIEIVWQVATVTVKPCERLLLVDPVIYSLLAKAILLWQLYFFLTEWVITCFYIQIFLIVVNLLVDGELTPYIHTFLLFCSFNLLWVEIFPTSLIFNLLCFKVC